MWNPHPWSRSGRRRPKRTLLELMQLEDRIVPSTIDVNPSNYRTLVPTAQPGDIVDFAPGNYASGLNLSSMHGTANAWITFTGPTSGPAAVIQGTSGANTVELDNTSYLKFEDFTVDSQDFNDAIKAGGAVGNVSHDILIQGNTIENAENPSDPQQTVGISTKCIAWNWTIEGNIIDDAGTGLYLGNSDGTDPFLNGIIENNLVENTIGYDMEIKDQIPYTTIAGMPTGPTNTIIRNNVFLKNDEPSPDGDRPNVFLGGFPNSGSGSSDTYQVYGNLFDHNPRESLLQVTGQASIHDNIFVDDTGFDAIAVQPHSEIDPNGNTVTFDVKQINIYNNTIYAVPTGISVQADPDGAPEKVPGVGNLVFADTAFRGITPKAGDNITDATANAGLYVTNPSTTLGQMNFYPLVGKAQGASLDLSPFASDPDYNLDFNETNKGTDTFRGAYAGSGANPGWQLQDGIKPLTQPAVPMLNVTDGGTYTSNPMAATATAVGTDGKTPVAGSFSYNYYAGSGTSGTNLGSTPPTNAGTYTVVAAFTSANSNYASGGTVQTTFHITPAPLTVTAVGLNKPSDGTTTAYVILSDNHLGNDQIADSYTSATFVDPNVGNAKPVTVSGISIAGPAAGNYTLQNTTAAATANITAAGANAATYDSKGRLLGIVYINGNVYERVYSSNGSSTATLTNSSGALLQTYNYDTQGQITSIDYANGNVLTYNYTFGAVTSATLINPNGPVANGVTSISYSYSGGQVTTAAYDLTNGNVMTYYYTNNVVTTATLTNSSGSVASGVTSITYTYSGGKVASVAYDLSNTNVMTYYYTSGALTSATLSNPNGTVANGVTSITYTYSGGKVTTAAYDLTNGNVMTYYYTNGVVTSAKLTNPNGTVASGVSSEDFTYNSSGKLSQFVVNYTNGYVYTRTYDSDGDGVSWATLANSSGVIVEYYEYNAQGSLTYEGSSKPSPWPPT